MSTSSFIMTKPMAQTIGLISTVLSGISLGFCLFILLASAWVYSVPAARHTIDRISFRMMCWSMLFGIAYDLCYILLEPRLRAIDPHSTGCKVVMYWQTVTMGAVNYFITCIAVNLMLSICFALNTMHLRLERWYIGVSLFFAFVVPIAPAVLGHFGFDPVYESCYFTSSSLKHRLTHFVLDLYLWQAASTLIACTAVVATLITLFRSGRATARALLYKDLSPARPAQPLQNQEKARSHGVSTAGLGSCPFKLKNVFRRKSAATQYRLQDQFLGVAFRIALYPILMVLMNTLLTVGDIYLSAHAVVDSRTVYGLYIIYYSLYGGRNLILAIIGIFVDPGLPRGLKLAWKASRRARDVQDEFDPSLMEEGDLDLVSALASVPYIPTASTATPKSGFVQWTKRTFRRFYEKTDQVEQATTSFNGVATQSLPEGMTDEVDIDPTVRVPGPTCPRAGQRSAPGTWRRRASAGAVLGHRAAEWRKGSERVKKVGGKGGDEDEARTREKDEDDVKEEADDNDEETVVDGEEQRRRLSEEAHKTFKDILLRL